MSKADETELPFKGICPECEKTFPLICREYGGGSIVVRSSESAGVYSVDIRCPHCKHSMDSLVYE